MLPPHDVLVDESTLAARVRELACEIETRLPGRDVLLVGVLTGSFVFVADLSRELARLGTDVRVELAWTSLYEGDGRPGGEVRLVRDIASDARGRSVLLVDDVLDSGRTLAFLKERLADREPAWLATCVLLAHRRSAHAADFVGFEAPDGWVFGYGMDTEGDGRALPHVCLRT